MTARRDGASAVLLARYRGEHEIVALLRSALPALGVDVIPWTRAELEQRLAQGDRLARAIVAEGELLFDRR